MMKRRELLGRAALSLAALPVLGSASAEAAPAARAVSRTERNKQLVMAADEELQRNAVPSTMPGAPVDKPRELMGSGSKATAAAMSIYACYDAPGGVDDPKSTIAAIAGWHVQTTHPPIHSWGPLIAEGDSVVVEREVFFYGLDGTMYNNVYCFLQTFDDQGHTVSNREYLDSHHAYVILSLHAPWKTLEPSRGPRRRWRGPAQSSLGLPPLTEMETVFKIRQEFDLDPRMLRDPVPGPASAPRFPDTAAGNKAVVRAMRDAQAKGDIAAVNNLHGPGFRHYIGGEGPLGWEHLPLQELYAPLTQHLAGPIKVRYGEMVAENGSVFEEMDILARLDDGTIYNNWHCFVHEVRDGRIVETREYLDTHHLWVTLGRWADWGKTPVPPQRRAKRSNLPYITASYQVRNPFLKMERYDPLPPVA
ncbi:MAG: hypothetical protein JWQ29_3164 [Phenylobacterium sp.]|nr:hypothetical protein [Phenylobacterium sp.]